MNNLLMERAVENYPVTTNVFQQKGEDVNIFSKTVRPVTDDNERVCKDCGDLFEITDNENAFYLSKGLQLPRRCKTCRIRRKRANNNWNESDFHYSFKHISEALALARKRLGLPV